MGRVLKNGQSQLLKLRQCCLGEILLQMRSRSLFAYKPKQSELKLEVLVVRSAIAQYLGKTDPAVVREAIADLQQRVTNLEQKLAGLGRLVGQ